MTPETPPNRVIKLDGLRVFESLFHGNTVFVRFIYWGDLTVHQVMVFKGKLIESLALIRQHEGVLLLCE